jgi:hypothetical protein
MKQTIILPKGRANRERAATVIQSLPMERAWSLTIAEYRLQRSQSQNAFLWATYQRIIELGGEDMAGWTKDDLHEFFLQNHFGHEEVTIFGLKRLRALRRSSKLSKIEFMDFVASIQRFMAERGVYLEDPNEV